MIWYDWYDWYDLIDMIWNYMIPQHVRPYEIYNTIQSDKLGYNMPHFNMKCYVAIRYLKIYHYPTGDICLGLRSVSVVAFTKKKKD